MQRWLQLLTMATLLGGFSSSLMAEMTVNPLRLDLNSQNSIASLSVLNRANDQSTLQVQVSVKAWTQANGKDVYSDQSNILLLPPMFGVPAGQSQIVRVALLQPNTTNAEQAYRIFIDQFNPQQIETQNTQGIKTALSVLLNISIPAFVATNEPEKLVLNWTLGAQTKQQLPLTATNVGNTHVHFAKVTLSDAKGVEVASSETPLYVLPGASMTDLLQVLKPLQAGETYTVKAETDDTHYSTLTGTVSF